MTRPSPEYLREALSYEASTGLLRWRERPSSHFKTEAAAYAWNRRHAGRPAFRNLSVAGYPQGKFRGHMLFAHRVIWAMSTGAWPALHLDHKDGNRSNNLLENLRQATRSQQCQNQIGRNPEVGFKGVTLAGPGFTDRKRYRARIKANGKQIFLGLYPSPEEAHAAYVAAAHKYFGEFARPD